MPTPRPTLPAFSVFAPKPLLDGIGNRKEAAATFQGAALFVDMSNYTSLAETLCRRGTDGREELSRVLNQVFGRLVDRVYRAGGEIASFTGDGVLAFWPATATSTDRAKTSAEACARALHRGQQDLVETSEMFPHLHIGLAAGELWAARLGGVDRIWHQILAGQAAREAFTAGNRAKPGETVTVRCAPESEPPHHGAPGLKDALAPFDPSDSVPLSHGVGDPAADLVPRMIREWWSDDRRRWLPQVRMISALFVKIDALPAERDDNLADYQRAVTALQQAIRPYSASSGTLVVDDKGLVFKLYFGMPYNSHRNDDTQALKAALAIEDALGAVGLPVSGGVAKGEGICMPIGGQERMEYSTVGRFAHLAARMMDAPGHGILCTAEVRDQAEGDIGLVERPPIALKGIREPLSVFSAETLPPAPPTRPSLKDREAEIALIENCLGRLRSGRGGILYILGDAGIGKTALIDHLIDITRSHNLTTLIGRSAMSEVVRPFQSWRPVFAALLDLADHHAPLAASAAGANRKLLDLPEDEQRLLPLINAVLPDMIEETSDMQKLGGEARVDATLSFLARLIRYLAPPGFILVLEDCHWMDSASWRLLERLTATSSDTLIVLTSRPEPNEAGLEAIRKKPRFRELQLQPLSVEAIKQIIQEAAPTNGDDGRDQTWLDHGADFAAGNALFAKEFAYLIAAESKTKPSVAVPAERPASPKGRLEPTQRRTTGSWPMTLQGLITSRLDSLGPPELLALKAASVIGSQFDLALLGHVVPDRPKPKTLLSTLADLLSRHLVLAIDGAANLYRFQHDLIREVVYGQLTRDQRRLLHNRTAEAIEEVHRDNLTAQFAALADHWSKADEGPRTLKYAELAAEQAIRSGGYEEARRLLSLCFAYADDQEQHRVPMARRLRWYRLSADTHFGLGNLDARKKDADAALRIAGRRRVRAKPRLVMGAVGQLAAWGGRRLLGRAHPTSPAGSPELSLELARIYRHHAATAWFSSDPVAMTAHSIAALRYAERGPPSDVLAGASVEFGGILGLLGMRPLGRSLMRRALAVAEQIDDQSMLAYVRMLICLYEVGVGNWPVADEHALASEALADDIGDRVNWSNVQAVRFWSRYYQNDLDAAEALAERFRERLEVDGNDQHRAWAHRFVALSALRRKRPDIAVDHLERASAYLRGATAANETLPAIGLLALARYRHGDRANAIGAALEGFSMIEDVGRPTGHAMLEGYAALTEVSFHALLEEPTSETWQAAFAQCMHGLDRFQRAFPIGRPRYRIWRGLEQALKGRHRASRKHLVQAEALSDRLGMSWERELAAMALAVGPDRFLRDLGDQDATLSSGASSTP